MEYSPNCQRAFVRHPAERGATAMLTFTSDTAVTDDFTADRLILRLEFNLSTGRNRFSQKSFRASLFAAKSQRKLPPENQDYRRSPPQPQRAGSEDCGSGEDSRVAGNWETSLLCCVREGIIDTQS